jgi:hypothetical protein
MKEWNPETLAFIAAHADDDVLTLALQADRYPAVDMHAALNQIAGRQIAARKLPSLSKVEGLRYPRHLSMEQCSSELTARFKAGLAHGDTLVDLTGGFGVDFAFMARNFSCAHYVERQQELCDLANHNFPLLGLTQAQVHQAEAEDYLQHMQPVSTIYLDPARRDDNGGKTVLLSDCQPDITRLEPLLFRSARTVLVKLSPMLDIKEALTKLHSVSHVYVVAVGNECKELVLRLDCTDSSLAPHGDALISCIHIHADGSQDDLTFLPFEEDEACCECVERVGEWLYEPNPAILKACAFKIITKHYKVHKLHPNSHLYTSDREITDFPGRRFHVEAVSGFGKKELKDFCKDLTQANLTVRNFPLTVAELRKRLKWKEGGDDYVFATTLADDRKVLIRGRKPSSKSC